MMKIADICPLIFNPIINHNKLDIDYIQKFYVTDTILLQAFGDETSFILKNLTDNTQQSITWNSYLYNETESVKYYGFTGLEDGIYSVIIGELESEPFEISSSSMLLDSTMLIKYSHKDNSTSHFDNIFWFGETQQIFELRIEGGITYNSAEISNEQFRNQLQEIVELYSVPYDTYLLSMGDASGIPYWFAQMLNRILSLSKIEINEINYVRSGNSKIEISIVSDDSQLYTLSVQVERLINEINGIGGEAETGSLVYPGINLTNPQDGQVLMYSSEESAIVNSSKV